MSKVMLSTNDNPFDPFEQFTPWDLYDKEKGHNSSELLARIARFSDDMTEKEEDDEIERAIDEIIKNDPLNKFIKVSKDVATDGIYLKE